MHWHSLCREVVDSQLETSKFRLEGLWAPWLSCRCPSSLQGSWTWWPLTVLSNSKDSVKFLHLFLVLPRGNKTASVKNYLQLSSSFTAKHCRQPHLQHGELNSSIIFVFKEKKRARNQDEHFFGCMWHTLLTVYIMRDKCGRILDALPILCHSLFRGLTVV